MRYTDKKLIISGNVVELYTYDEKIRIDPLPQSRPGKPKERFSKNDERTDSSLHRSKKQLKRLINANVGFHKDEAGKLYKPVFVTLTFKENVIDVDQANYEFTKFIQRLNFQLFKERISHLMYVVAIEFQKRGAVHYHVVFFNLPFVYKIRDRLGKIWGGGMVDAQSVKNTIHDVGNYLTKYMTKEQSDPRLCGKKSYFSSKNLYKPVTIKDPAKIFAIMHFIDAKEKQYERRVENPEYGPPYRYEIYNVRDSGYIEGVLALFVKSDYFGSQL